MDYYLNLFNNGGTIECSCIHKTSTEKNIEIASGDTIEIAHNGTLIEVLYQIQDGQPVLKAGDLLIKDIQGTEVNRITKNKIQ